ncbi:MAG: ribbon-helix-helix protein, CopG family [Deltaproteobacteria bacterium]|nr:ribbon-helix-helix protein, CopG family [Deltaproteobacteria bacterium]
MSQLLRTTVYLDNELHRALKLKAAETGANISGLINDAVRQLLTEDLGDLTVVTERAKEPTRAFEDFLGELARDGLI